MSCQRGPIHHPSKPAFNYSGLPLGAGWLSGPDRDVSNHYFSTPNVAAHCSEFSTEIHLATYIPIYLRPQDGLTPIFFPVPPEYTSVSYYTSPFLFCSLSLICKVKFLVLFHQVVLRDPLCPNPNHFTDFQEKLYEYYKIHYISKYVIFSFLQSVITTWRTSEIVVTLAPLILGS